jgi:hypothetical protein
VAGHGFIQVYVGIDDLEESKNVLVDVDAAELSNFVGCVSNKANEVAAEVSMNLRSIDVGKVGETWSNGPKGGDRAGANTSKDMVEVLSGKKVVGLVQRTGEVAPFGVKFGVVGSRSAHAVVEVSVKEIRLCQTLSPSLMMEKGDMSSLNQINDSD